MVKIKVKKEQLNIKATIECGQVFRYEKLGADKYRVISLDKSCLLYEDKGCAVIETEHPDYFVRYFDIGTNYETIRKKLLTFNELVDAVNFGQGLRILRQDLYETVISFIVSANNNIARIKKIIERLCQKYGENKGDYYAFPTLEQLKTATVDELTAIGLGYRAKYIYDSVRRYESVEKELRDNVQNAKQILLKLQGVGEKVANCITLFGLYQTDSYPVDTWIFRSCRNEVLNTKKKVYDYYTTRYGKESGYAQQYIFYYTRQNKK